MKIISLGNRASVEEYLGKERITNKLLDVNIPNLRPYAQLHTSPEREKNDNEIFITIL